MLRQYQPYANYSQPSSGLKYILYGLIGLVILFLLGYFFLSSGGARCGNGLCERGEDCLTCKRDCGCAEGERCYEGKCVKIECGNGRCEPGETMVNCCEDCGCEQGQRCVNNTCQYLFSLTDSEVKEKMNNYLDQHGYVNYSFDIDGTYKYNGKLVKFIYVYINGTTFSFGIDESGNIYDYGEAL